MNEHHHTRGMSRWPAILECNCFTSKPSSKDATFGSEKHAQLAEMLNHLKQHGSLPATLEDGFFDAGVRRTAEFIASCMIATNTPAAALHVEDRVTLEGGIFGTADAWYITDEKIVVWDFKTFRNPGRDYTAQLAGYALAIRQNNADAPNTFSLRTIYGDSTEVNEVTMSAGEAFDTYLQAMSAFDSADTAQPKQCNWCDLCDRAAECSAYRAIAEAVSSRTDLATAPQNWSMLSRENKAQMLVLAETVCKWADAVRGKAKDDLLAGESIADEANGISYKLRNVNGRKTPRTADACAMLTAKGVTAEAIRSKLTLAATAIKELLKTVGIKGKDADALVETVCDVSAGTVQMVRG